MSAILVSWKPCPRGHDGRAEELVAGALLPPLEAGGARGDGE
jgi:hypothetical protein